MNHLIFSVGFFFATIALTTLYDDLSSLERCSVDDGLKQFELKPDLNPSGKVIKTIYVVTSAPFSQESGFLTKLNNLHIATKDEIIKWEIMLKEGQPYDPAQIIDSEIALRSFDKVRSLAVIIPVRGKSTDPDEVDLLIATQDLLSLRPTFSFKASGFGDGFTITNAAVSLDEHNFLGLNKSVGMAYELQQGAHILTPRFSDPHLFGSRIQLALRPSILLARTPQDRNGFNGVLKIRRPLLFESDRFGYGLDLTYASFQRTDFQGKDVRLVEIDGPGGKELVQKKYYWQNFKGELSGRYSFGLSQKKEVFFSYNLSIKRPSILEHLNLTNFQKDYFKQNIMPRNEIESFITLGFAYFENRYLTLYDYENYRLQETERLGPNLTISNDFASKEILFSDANFLRPELKFSYTQAILDDAFLEAGVSTSNRFDGSFNDNFYKFGIIAVSPKIFKLGRAILDAELSLSYGARDNQNFSYGSDSGLRGVESRYFLGSKGFRSNFELRSAPLDIWIIQAGLVFFYDVGAAFESFKKVNPTHALGLGLRVLAPQVSSIPFRIDFAFPIAGPGSRDHVVFPSFGTGQAF